MSNLCSTKTQLKEQRKNKMERLSSPLFSLSPKFLRERVEEKCEAVFRLDPRQCQGLSMPNIAVTRLAHNADLPLPAYETAGSAGMDLRAAVAEDAPVTLRPGARDMIPTGLAIALPEGFEAQVRPRSGLAAKAGVTCLNTPGTVDSDYRGEVKVILVNLGADDFVIRRGDRIAQMVIAPVVQASWAEVASLDETARGAGGFGSTGR
jgi:dUTP pyrophosphatase